MVILLAGEGAALAGALSAPRITTRTATPTGNGRRTRMTDTPSHGAPRSTSHDTWHVDALLDDNHSPVSRTASLKLYVRVSSRSTRGLPTNLPFPRTRSSNHPGSTHPAPGEPSGGRRGSQS